MTSSLRITTAVAALGGAAFGLALGGLLLRPDAPVQASVGGGARGSEVASLVAAAEALERAAGALAKGAEAQDELAPVSAPVTAPAGARSPASDPRIAELTRRIEELERALARGGSAGGAGPRPLPGRTRETNWDEVSGLWADNPESGSSVREPSLLLLTDRELLERFGRPSSIEVLQVGLEWRYAREGMGKLRIGLRDGYVVYARTTRD